MKKLKERKFLQALQEGMDDIKAGHVSEDSEVFARLRNKLNASNKIVANPSATLKIN